MGYVNAAFLRDVARASGVRPPTVNWSAAAASGSPVLRASCG